MKPAVKCNATLKRFGECGLPAGHSGYHSNVGGGWTWADSTSGATPHTDAALARVKELEAAIREIVRGKIAVDNEHPLGPLPAMAFRFHDIARAALARGKP